MDCNPPGSSFRGILDLMMIYDDKGGGEAAGREKEALVSRAFQTLESSGPELYHLLTDSPNSSS